MAHEACLSRDLPPAGLARLLPERAGPLQRGDLSFARTVGAPAGGGTTRSPRPLSSPQLYGSPP
ncbi:hypothetical protein EU555_35255 [Methylobacterium nonmethylotrophicum]|uniref:Uncharacterized protein n=1 Tax=Methylobacterium nonmethylotrophicum TaxID=1141884 RepID=A0A4Z0ND62_9HYPH|nr:hypothetical protein EU555_35255 [Methylobacterium nonmethylotrophicum]